MNIYEVRLSQTTIRNISSNPRVAINKALKVSFSSPVIGKYGGYRSSQLAVGETLLVACTRIG